MTTNPFDDESGRFYVLANDEQQHSLWPAFAGVPAGWHVVLDEGDRSAALAYIEHRWPDISPRSLRDSLASEGAGS